MSRGGQAGRGALPALRLWIMAMRPRTLTLILSPVLTGAALVRAEGGGTDLPLLAVILLTALAIQAGTNLHNDAADAGADARGRIGPARVSARGLLPRGGVRRAAWIAYGLAALSGAWLVWKGGWPIALTGVLSLLAGASYSAGPRPISHSPFGELFVVVFFGLVAVGGTCYLLAGAVSPRAVAAGLFVGLPAAAVLTVNNTRDMRQDVAAGRRTLAIVLGRKGAAALYGVLILTPFALALFPAAGLHGRSGGVPWPVLPALPYAAWLTWRFATRPPEAFNALLADTAKLQLAMSALLCLSLLR